VIGVTFELNRTNGRRDRNAQLLQLPRKVNFVPKRFRKKTAFL
jgi:hypothetical protein